MSLWIFRFASADAETHRLRTFTFAPKQPPWSLVDMSGQFSQQALALTPEGDLLALSPRRSGTWDLYRIRRWDSADPAVEHLQLPGHPSSQNQHDLEQLDVRLYVSRDGRYATCVGDAFWLKRTNGKPVGPSRTQGIITVIDLSAFHPVGRLDTKDLHPLEFQGIEMDRAGRVVVSSRSAGENHPAEFTQLAVPSLRPAPKCSYRTEANKMHSESFIPITPATCQNAIDSLSLEQYLKQLAPSSMTSTGYICKQTGVEYCPQPDHFTPDQRFGLGIRTQGHDSLLGSWVQTRATAILFSTSTHTEVDAWDMTGSSAHLLLASRQGKDFLLAIEAGSKLTVYQLPDQSRETISH